MKNAFSLNIAKYRKNKNLTQEQLSNLLGLSFQAISKWERGISMPDTELLPLISKTLKVSLDKLFGYPSTEKSITIYDEKYNINNYYWGVVPSKKCLKILEIMPVKKELKLLDIACGEGKDAVFLAKNGYNVSAFDISEVGLKKTETLAKKHNVCINLFKANILDYRLENKFDILYSNGSFHYISETLRDEIISNYKNFTNTNGINFFSVFVNKPFIKIAPDNESTSYPWKTGELFKYYNDWLISNLEEYIFDCNSSNIPHRHAVNSILAKKI